MTRSVAGLHAHLFSCQLRSLLVLCIQFCEMPCGFPWSYVCVCLRRDRVHFEVSLLVHSILLSRVGLVHYVFCMVSKLEIPCLLKPHFMLLPLMICLQIFHKINFISDNVWLTCSCNKNFCNILLGLAIAFARGMEKKNYKSLLNITNREVR